MKNPNGYGSVYKLSGNRRKPFVAIVTDKWVLDGKKAIQKRKPIGYYPTQAEAKKALASYNENPYNLDNNKLTFAEVYDLWSNRKFQEVSDSNINGYKASFKTCEKIHNLQFSSIKLSHLQSVVDESNKNYPTLKKLKSLFSQIFDFAVENEIIGRDKHIVEYVKIGEPVYSTLHYRFTENDIQTMWNWSETNDYVQVILMLIYCGCRPGELFNLNKSDIHLEDRYFRIKKGKNKNAIRNVPIHEKLVPFYENWLSKNDSEGFITQINGKKINLSSGHNQFTQTYWYPVLTDMGILEYINENGEIKKHLPDDTRHTFTTRWKEQHLDEAIRRKIQGHSGKGIGEIVYTHFEFKCVLDELNKLK